MWNGNNDYHDDDYGGYSTPRSGSHPSYDGDSDYFEAQDAWGDRYGGFQGAQPENGGWLSQIRGLLNWDEVASEIAQESQARLAIVGLPRSGKRTLFNHLRGWDLLEPVVHSDEMDELIQVEPYGAFVLGRLPLNARHIQSGMEINMALGDPQLVLYLIDGEYGVRAADYRWISLLRHSGRPLVIALNKVDLLQNEADRDRMLAEVESKMGCSVVPISSLLGQGVNDDLLPAVLQASPKLTIPLGREIQSLRRVAARKVINQTAVFAGLVSTQPIPFLDIPLQAALQVGLVMRIGAAYGRPARSGMTRENVGAVLSTLAARYLMQTALKFVPILGWAASGAIGWVATFGVGELAIRYYESDSQNSWSHWVRLRPHLALPKQLSWDWFRLKPIHHLHEPEGKLTEIEKGEPHE